MKRLLFTATCLASIFKIYSQNISIQSNYLKVYVSAAGSSTSNNTPVILWGDECQTDNVWVKVSVPGSSNIKIKNNKSGKFLAVAGGGTSNGSKIVLYEDMGQRDILWSIEPIEYGFSKVKNVNSAKYLAVESGATNNGAKLVLWTNNNQQDIKWLLSDLILSANEISQNLYFRNCNSDLYMKASNSADYSNLVQSNAEPQEIWQIERSGAYYKIKSTTSNKYVGVSSGSNSAGADIVITPDRGQPDIQWEILRVSPTGVKFRNKQSGLFIGVQNAATTNGSKMVQWRDENQKDIIWKLEYRIY